MDSVFATQSLNEPRMISPQAESLLPLLDDLVSWTERSSEENKRFDYREVNDLDETLLERCMNDTNKVFIEAQLARIILESQDLGCVLKAATVLTNLSRGRQARSRFIRNPDVVRSLIINSRTYRQRNIFYIDVNDEQRNRDKIARLCLSSIKNIFRGPLTKDDKMATLNLINDVIEFSSFWVGEELVRPTVNALFSGLLGDDREVQAASLQSLVDLAKDGFEHVYLTSEPFFSLIVDTASPRGKFSENTPLVEYIALALRLSFNNHDVLRYILHRPAEDDYVNELCKEPLRSAIVNALWNGNMKIDVVLLPNSAIPKLLAGVQVGNDDVVSMVLDCLGAFCSPKGILDEQSNINKVYTSGLMSRIMDIARDSSRTLPIRIKAFSVLRKSAHTHYHQIRLDHLSFAQELIAKTDGISRQILLEVLDLVDAAAMHPVEGIFPFHEQLLSRLRLLLWSPDDQIRMKTISIFSNYIEARKRRKTPTLNIREFPDFELLFSAVVDATHYRFPTALRETALKCLRVAVYQECFSGINRRLMGEFAAGLRPLRRTDMLQSKIKGIMLVHLKVDDVLLRYWWTTCAMMSVTSIERLKVSPLNALPNDIIKRIALAAAPLIRETFVADVSKL